MDKVSLSFNHGKGHIRHNTREYMARNVDEEKTKNNICYVNEPLEHVYQKIFSEAIKEHDEKQKRSDRKIGSVEKYTTKIKGSKNGEMLFHEIIIQLGDKTSSMVGSDGGEKAKKVLDRYAREFQSRNPNLRVFSSHLHLDETTPHLHIDFVPVGEYSRGLAKRNSMRQALACQGITSAGTNKDNNLVAWEKREREEIKRLCSQLNIEVSTENKARGTLSVKEYKVAKEVIAKVRAEVNAELAQTKKLEEKKTIFGRKKVMTPEFWNAFVKDYQAVATDLEFTKKRAEELEAENKKAHEFFLQTQRWSQELKERDIQQTQEKKELIEKEKRCKKLLNLDFNQFWKEKFEKIKEIWHSKINELRTNINDLLTRNQELEKKINQQTQEKKELSDRLDLFANEQYENNIRDDLKEFGLKDETVHYDRNNDITRGQIVTAGNKYNHNGYVVVMDEKKELHARFNVPISVIKEIGHEMVKNSNQNQPTVITITGYSYSTKAVFEDFKEYVRKLHKTKSR